jgi:hypothetical protein
MSYDQSQIIYGNRQFFPTKIYLPRKRGRNRGDSLWDMDKPKTTWMLVVPVIYRLDFLERSEHKMQLADDDL